MKYSMEAAIEATRLEEQVFQGNYSLTQELSGFKFQPGEAVMDAGCGTGVLSRHLVETFGVRQVDAVDSSDLRLKQAENLCSGKTKKAISFHCQDLENLNPSFHGKYDTVICRYVIEHCASPKKVLAELGKALKPGGRLIVFELDGVFVNLYSENARFNAYMEEFKKAVKFDLYIGKKMPNYLKQAGFKKIQWDAETLCCKGKRLEEERRNTEMRFAAVGPFLAELFGSVERSQEFQKLYLDELVKPENTLVFTKYICSGTKE